jgi:hypothetical protein
MPSLTRALFLSAVALVCIVAQEFHLVGVLGVTPNLLLVLFAVLTVRREPVPVLVVLGCVLAILAVVFTPFWLGPFAVFAVVIIALFFIVRTLTGNRTADALVFIILGTVLFSLVQSLVSGVPFPWFSVCIELGLNCVVGVLVALVALRDVPSAR